MTSENQIDRLPKCYGIIPARYGSKRFPGKPLADILGKPMIRHVYERARQCHRMTAVYLATDDERIRMVAQKWDIPVVMTRNTHPSGTDRVMEAAEKLNLDKDSIIVNIQGDEPALEPEMLTQLVCPFRASDVQVTTLARKIDRAEIENPDLVKVVFTEDGRALYFSRSPIPHHSDSLKNQYYGHIGIYAFRLNTLEQFVTLQQGRLEIAERLEQLRLIENNIAIRVVVTDHNTCGVDRPEDIEKVKKILKKISYNRVDA
jgi:3-deoxy-manno-octulosonate cytidylyltransferase (CMP-KDO synthetase)